jgi:hypothetical protein
MIFLRPLPLPCSGKCLESSGKLQKERTAIRDAVELVMAAAVAAIPRGGAIGMKGRHLENWVA